MPSIGGTELVIILVFAFLLFGPDKLPQMGRTIGRALRQFRETQQKLTDVVQTEVVDPMAAAANAPKPKKGAAAGTAPAAADDDDADIESTSGSAAAPRRKETFAERRARLAAEKAEREAAEAAPEADEVAGTASAAPAAASAEAAPAQKPAAAEPADTPAPAAEAAAEEPQVTTTEDLYARRPRKHRKAEPAAAADATVEGDATADTAKTTEGGER